MTKRKGLDRRDFIKASALGLAGVGTTFAAKPASAGQTGQAPAPKIPLTAEIYWQLRQGGAPPFKNYSFHRIADRLPELCSQAEQACQSNTANRYLDEPRNNLLFVTLRYWIEHGIILALSLAGLGHNLTLLFLPSTRWDRLTARFGARRLNAYTHKVLSPTSTLINPVSLVDITRFQNTRDTEIALPQEIAVVIREVSIRDLNTPCKSKRLTRIRNHPPPPLLALAVPTRAARRAGAATPRRRALRAGGLHGRPALVRRPAPQAHPDGRHRAGVQRLPALSLAAVAARRGGRPLCIRAWCGAAVRGGDRRSRRRAAVEASRAAGPGAVAARPRARGGDGAADVEGWRVPVPARVGHGAGFDVPKSRLQELVAYYTKSASHPDGYSLDAPFTLSGGIRQITVESGRAIVIQ